MDTKTEGLLPHCTVVIPTKNAMQYLARVLGSVRQQVTPWPFAIIVIDSGSSDGTVEYLQAQRDVRLFRVAPEAFGHGHTRNQAIAASEAPFVALLTQDAEPVNNEWLTNLVAAVEQSDAIAGAFGRHVAYPYANPFTKRDIEQHFRRFLAYPLIVNKNLDVIKYECDVTWRQFLHFYSNNNSCLRRSVWERNPYPNVKFAEDQLWAKQIIEKGFSKAYAPSAVVYHSHEYGLFERLQRAFDESKNFQIHFGYDLAPNIFAAWHSVVRLSARDIAFAKGHSELFPSPVKVFRQILMNLMVVMGHYLGTHHVRLPRRVHRRLSRDERLQYLKS